MATTIVPMTETAGGVTRTERGLTIAGTRINIYEVMDFLQAGWPPLLIQNALNLTAAQMQAALDYLQTYPAETEAEYQTVLAQADADRAYWQERNRERLEATPQPEPNPAQGELRARLAAWKARSDAA